MQGRCCGPGAPCVHRGRREKRLSGEPRGKDDVAADGLRIPRTRQNGAEAPCQEQNPSVIAIKNHKLADYYLKASCLLL